MVRIHLSKALYLSKDITYLQDRAANTPYKPCGLWYSFGDDWKEHYEAFEMAKAEGKVLRTEDGFLYMYNQYLTKYEVVPDRTKMCILSTPTEVLSFHMEYRIKNGNLPYGIDWKRVTEDFAGIEIQNYHDVYNEVLFYAVTWIGRWQMGGGCIWDLNGVEINRL